MISFFTLYATDLHIFSSVVQPVFHSKYFSLEAKIKKFSKLLHPLLPLAALSFRFSK